MITQSKGGKEAPPLMKPSYSGGNKQATGEETFHGLFKRSFVEQQVAPSRAVSRTEKSSSSAEKKCPESEFAAVLPRDETRGAK